jgi:hypothetical protein
MDLLPFTANCTPKSLSIRYLNILDSTDRYATLILYPIKGIGADRLKNEQFRYIVRTLGFTLCS